MSSMRTIYGDTTALGSVNQYDNQFNRVFVRDGLEYESEPLVSGYFFLSFNYPKTIANPNNRQYGAADRDASMAVLNAVNLGIDLPDISITVVTVDGLGGTWNSVPGRLDIGKTFNVKYWETFNGEVVSIHRQWLFQLRDPRSGAGRVGTNSGTMSKATNYRQDRYKGQLWWFMTDPNIDRVIFAIEFLGIWPTNLPLSNINQDVATNEKVEITITYSYDRPFFYPGAVLHASTNYLGKRYGQMLAIDSDNGSIEG